MDIDQLKSSTSSEDDQMEMMMMMMMDNKLPDLFDTNPDVSALDLSPQTHHFQGATTTTKYLLPKPISHGTSQSSMSTVPFANNNTQFQVQSSQTTTRLRGVVGDFPVGDASFTPSQKKNSMAAIREMIFRIAAMQPIHIDPESVKPPKRRNVKISKDPQSVAARHRRERISEKIRILQRLVPGGTKMDTASMLDEAIHYVKFLKLQVQTLERAQAHRPFSSSSSSWVGFPVAMACPLMTNDHQNVD